MLRVAINGFGRIGKTFLRVLLSDPEVRKKISIVAINIGPNDPEAVAYQCKFDSIMGTYQGSVVYTNNQLCIDGEKILICAEPDPKKSPWAALDIDWVIESSGRFVKRDQAAWHLYAGAKKVLVTAPMSDDDCTIILGVNAGAYDAEKHIIVSLGSCTSNAVMPLLAIMHDAYDIETAAISTTHAYTNSQALLDVNASSKDVRRSRAAALNIVPTSTGALNVIAKVLPALSGRVVAHALRVPVGIVSFLDVVVYINKQCSVTDLSILFSDHAKKAFKGIIAVEHEELVSSDFQKNPHSVIIDACLMQIAGRCVKIGGWYDNEWGYAHRLKDFLQNITE